MSDKSENNLTLSALDNLQVVSFNLGSEEFALNIGYVQEIIELQRITSVPLTPSYVEGVINIRGNIIPVVNLRLKMNFKSAEITPQTRIMVVSFENRRVGFVVDNMNEVIEVPHQKIHSPTSEAVDQSDDKNIVGICVLDDRLISILDIKKILEIN